MKMRKQIIVVGLTAVAALNIMYFQNCSGNFKVSDEFSANAQAQLSVPTIELENEKDLFNSGNVDFKFKIGVNPATSLEKVTCALNDGDATSCEGLATSFVGLADGDYALRITATTSAAVSADLIKLFRVDATVPVVVVSSVPPVFSNQTMPSILFQSSDILSGVVSTECALDAGAFAACVSPFKPTLAEGARMLKIRATDKAGNISAVYSYQWTIDLSKPTVVFSATPALVTNSVNAVFKFSGDKLVSFECKLDGTANFTACAIDTSFYALAGGPHSLQVRGTSNAGNLSDIATFSWSVDVTPPTVPAITAGVTALTAQKSATFSFVSTDASSGLDRYTCSLDSANDANFAACSAPVAYTGLSDGAHAFRVRAYDKATNVSAVSVFNWTIDSTPPAMPSLSMNVTSPTNATTATMTFASSDAGSGVASFTCLLDGSPTTGCTSPRALSALGEGSHSFQVTAFDTAGNRSEIASTTWVVDATPPTITLVTMVPSAFATTTNSASEIFSFAVSDSGSGVSIVKCALDTSPLVACSGTYSVSSLTVGAHKFTVQASDVVSNISTKTFQWTYAPPAQAPLGVPEYGVTSYSQVNAAYLRPSVAFMDSTKTRAFVHSACGDFQSTDSGKTFNPIDFKIPRTINEIAVSGSRVIIAAQDGLYVSNDGGVTFRNTLSAATATSILAAMNPSPFPCSAVGISIHEIKKVAMSGDLVVAVGAGLWVSQDGGQTFTVPVMSSGGYYIGPMLSEIKGLTIQGSEIMVAANWTNSPTLYTKPLSGGSCATVAVPPAGILTSVDGGRTFKAIPAAGASYSSALRLKGTPATIVGFGDTSSSYSVSRKVIRSLDDGASFAASTDPNVAGYALWGNDGSPNFLAEIQNSLYLNVVAGGSQTKYFRSANGGANWSAVSLDAKQPDFEVIPFNTVDVSGAVGVSTNQGFMTSSNGTDFGTGSSNLTRFSSNFCGYPWWNHLRAVAASGSNVYSASTGTSTILASKDAGLTFSAAKLAGISFSVWDLMASGNRLFLLSDGGTGIAVSNDNGATVGALAASAQDPSTGFTYYPIRSSGGYGFYVSTDGTDQRSQLSAFLATPGTNLLSAVSFGTRIVITTSTDIVTFDNGTLTTRILGVGPLGTMKMRLVNDVLYVMGQDLWASRDHGSTWAKVSSAPMRPYDIWSNNGVVQTATQFNGFLYSSADNGASFTPWRGSLVKPK